MTLYKTTPHQCPFKRVSVNSSQDFWSVYECTPARNEQVDTQFQLWVHFEEQIGDEHGVYINYCPFCGHKFRELE